MSGRTSVPELNELSSFAYFGLVFSGRQKGGEGGVLGVANGGTISRLKAP